MLREVLDWKERLSAGRFAVTTDETGVTVEAAGLAENGQPLRLLREYAYCEMDGVTAPGVFMVRFESEWTALRRRVEGTDGR